MQGPNREDFDMSKNTLKALALMGAAMLLNLYTASAWGQAANDVVCTGCVNTGDIADGAVTGNKLAQGSILTGKFADGSVTGNKLANGSILTGKFADGSVTGNKLAQGAVLAGKLANGAVRTGKIADGAVTFAKLAPGVMAAIPSPDPVTDNVDCSLGDSIQDAVDAVVPGQPTTIFLSGTCTEDVFIAKDDITLSGNEMDAVCNKADPSASADATINGTITVDGVRARIEHLVITGNGAGVSVTNRADARLTCNDISSNQAGGVSVTRTSNAVLRDNTLSSNGQRSFNSPFIFFDVGLFLGNASSVQSNGNTYTDNQYAAIASNTQSAFRNASFLPRENGHPPIAAEKDVIIQKGGDPAIPATCKTNGGPLAVTLFNIGHAEFRNADICGEFDVGIGSSMRIDDAGGEIIGNVSASGGSWVRIRDRSGFGDGRLTTFDGTLTCSGGSQTFGSNVQCGQTCSGAIPGTC